MLQLNIEYIANVLYWAIVQHEDDFMLGFTGVGKMEKLTGIPINTPEDCELFQAAVAFLKERELLAGECECKYTPDEADINEEEYAGSEPPPREGFITAQVEYCCTDTYRSNVPYMGQASLGKDRPHP